ncbi:MAG: helix-hairpin-helix domain-containing protein [PVC group bacterium]
MRIIEYREKAGGFKRTDELMEVWGIGPKTYESLKNLVTVQSGFVDRSFPGNGPQKPPRGPRTMKCWRCGDTFTAGEGVTSGKCPSCGTTWKAR